MSGDTEIIRKDRPGEFTIRRKGYPDIPYRADETTCKSLRRLEWKAARADDDNYDKLVDALDARLNEIARQLLTMFGQEAHDATPDQNVPPEQRDQAGVGNSSGVVRVEPEGTGRDADITVL